MYPSPQVDFGYDISDYEAVDPQYGSLADMDRLVKTAGQHKIRVILDMVLNHTSDQHKWFLEAKSSRTNPKHDWYVWNDGIAANAPGVTAYQKRYEHEGKVPPTNWTSIFGGSSWEWVPAIHQFYYHRFYKQQPDLNWNNPAVEKAMFDSMRFWLDRGVAGFRLDAIPSLFEDPQLRNEQATGGTNAQGDPNLEDTYVDNLPEVHGTIRRMRAMANSYSGTGFPGARVLIGETYLPNTAELSKWYGGPALNELQMPMDMLVGFHNKLSATDFRKLITEVETLLPGAQPLFVLENHDNPRIAQRYGDGVHDVQIEKLLAAMLFTSKSTAMMYYGGELGMQTNTPTRVEDVKDPIGITGWPKEKGRDGERTPMQWTPGAQAGFSTDPKTWLPIPASSATINVQTEADQPDSMLNWYKHLIALRRTNAALHNGGVVMLDTANPNVLSYVRTPPAGGRAVVVSLNMSAQPQTPSLDVTAAGLTPGKVKTLMADDASLKAVTDLKQVTLPPYGAWVGELQ